MDQKQNEITTGKTMQAPSSMGVSVVIGDSVSEIKIDSSWGRYCDAKPSLGANHFSRDLHIPEEAQSNLFRTHASEFNWKKRVYSSTSEGKSWMGSATSAHGQSN